jgi:hypothetical protein
MESTSSAEYVPFHRSIIAVIGGEHMAIYHCCIKIIKRSEGRSAVAAAAYRSGEKLINEWDGMIHDYTKKRGVAHTEILLPSHAPPEFQDRSVLWNSVEKIEKSRDAQLAREIEIALPVELNREEQISLCPRLCPGQFCCRRDVRGLCYSRQGRRQSSCSHYVNHAPLKENGEWGAKCRKEYDLDEHGQRIRFPSGKFKSHRVNITDWNEQDKAEEWRAVWAEYANHALEQKGLSERIDHRSYVRQGVEQIPTVHMGVAATQMERRGLITEKAASTGNRRSEQTTEKIKARITPFTTGQKNNPNSRAKSEVFWTASTGTEHSQAYHHPTARSRLSKKAPPFSTF